MKIEARHAAVGRKAVGIVAGIFLVVALAGCQSWRLGNCSTPEVTGRVLSADTREPLAGVTVARVVPARLRDADTDKGAQLLGEAPPVTTDAAGHFGFPSRSYFFILHRADWWTMQLSFQSRGHVDFQTNLTPASVTGQLPDGTPQADLGEILLAPIAP